MKIAPITERWNQGERDWTYVDDAGPAIDAWERRTGMTLPADYRRFMQRYNGGRVYPRQFRSAAAGAGMLGPYEPADDLTLVDPILRWASVEAHWRGEVYGAGVPPLHLVIAATPGTIQLLMDLDADRAGRISAWHHSSAVWGTDGNTRLWPLAASFTAFLAGLSDADGSDYGNWRIPIYDRLARDLEL